MAGERETGNYTRLQTASITTGPGWGLHVGVANRKTCPPGVCLPKGVGPCVLKAVALTALAAEDVHGVIIAHDGKTVDPDATAMAWGT